MAYRYRVKATCTAYVGEDWTVTSDRPLTLDEAEGAVLGDFDIDGDDRNIRIACVDQDVSDEHDRSVVESFVLDYDDEDAQENARVEATVENFRENFKAPEPLPPVLRPKREGE